MNKIIITVLYFMITAVFCSSAVDDDVIRCVKKSELLLEKHPPKAGDSYAYKTMFNHQESESTVHAVIALWKLGEESDVYLMWWQSEDPVVRKVCYTLFALKPGNRMQMKQEREKYFKYVKRFNSMESEKRLHEIKEILMDEQGYKNLLKFVWRK